MNNLRYKLRKLLNIGEACIYAHKYKQPAHKLTIIGITGTDGKTTTSNILYTILKENNLKTGVLTTINADIGDTKVPTGLHVTSPRPKKVQQFLDQMVKNGLTHLALETTSHALDQKRYAFIKYQGGIITNVTHEHLDYHKTYLNYIQTKAQLIKKIKKNGFILLNRDDQSFDILNSIAQKHNIKVITYGITNPNCMISATDINLTKDRTTFTISTPQSDPIQISTNLKGEYNIYNLLAAIGAALQLGISLSNIIPVIKNLPNLEGRWEVIKEKPFKVIVDFAHTPNALKQVLTVANQRKKGDIILVFGSAGKRDASKRVLMGKIAEQYADKIILTAEDPRGEDVSQICNNILQGTQNKRKFQIIKDRKEAIKKALSIAQANDIILITGKGHEQSMNLDGINEIPWDDREVTRELLKTNS